MLLASTLARGEPQLGAARQAEPDGNLPAAERAYELELKARPTAGNWQRLGLIRHLQNKFESAIPAFREAIRIDPGLWTSHLFLGICLYRTNQFASAVKGIEEADRLAPREGRGRDEIDYWLGATRIALKQPLSGLQALERLLARSPDHKEALDLATRTYADLGTALWNDVAERHFETPAGYEVHGHALESEGNVPGAIEALRQSKALAPQRAGPGLALGRLLLRQGQAEEAFDILSREATLPGAEPEAAFYAGLAAIQLGRFNEASASLEKAAQWSRQNPEAHLALAQVHLALGEIEKAVEAARTAVDLAPASEAAHELLLAALAQAGKTASIEQEQRRWRERNLK